MIGNPHGYYAPPVHITKSHRTEHAYVLRRECSGTTSEKDRSLPLKRAEIPIQTGEGQAQRNQQTGTTE
jgi:hypothetical protein